MRAEPVPAPTQIDLEPLLKHWRQSRDNSKAAFP